MKIIIGSIVFWLIVLFIAIRLTKPEKGKPIETQEGTDYV